MHYDETEKRGHDSQIVRAKENLKLTMVGPATAKRQLSSIHDDYYGICLLSIDRGDVASLPAKLHSDWRNVK